MEPNHGANHGDLVQYLGKDWDKARHGMWMGFFTNKLADPVAVFQNCSTFDAQCTKKPG